MYFNLDKVGACKCHLSHGQTEPQSISNRGAAAGGWREGTSNPTPGRSAAKPRPLRGRLLDEAQRTDGTPRGGEGGRLGARHPRGEPAASVRMRRFGHTKASAPRSTARLTESGRPAAAAEHPPPSEHRQAERLVSLYYCCPEREQPLALPLPLGSAGAGEDLPSSGWLQSALHGAPPRPLYSVLPASRSLSPLQRQPPSKEHMLPLRLLARLTLSCGQRRKAPVAKPDQKRGICRRVAELTANAESDVSPVSISIIHRRFAVSCRYHNASASQVSRKQSLHSPTYHS